MKKKLKLKSIDMSIVYFISLSFIELMFRVFTDSSIFNVSILYVTLFNIVLSLILSIITSLGKPVLNKVLFYIFEFLISLIYVIELCVYRMFGFYFELSLFGATDQVAGFASDGVNLVLANIGAIIVLFLPFILSLVVVKLFTIKKRKWQVHLVKLGSAVAVFIIFLLSLNIGKNEINSAHSLYYDTNNIELSIKKFGVSHAFLQDVVRYVTGFEDKIVVLDKPSSIKNNETPTEIVYDYNNLDIDFTSLIENEKNSTIKKMHEYFNSEEGTLQNEYTGYFKGKNLILFMAESFNEIAVRKDTTPTLYKLVNSGFVFENFYTPTIMSTIGGEYQEITGTVATSGFLSIWRSGKNYYPMGLATMFQNAGYETFAYHNNSAYFQDRNKYLAALGFDNFKGCYNGLEKLINCKQWPESDYEMIDATIADYLDTGSPFMTYYVTVSGHGDYGWASSAMARKHRDEVSGLNYSEKPLSYLAANIELDQALELLIKKLDEAGILADTVIALVGDHYPYYLELNEVNEIASYEKDKVVEINHSNFILWNSEMPTVTVTKVGSQIDVLPTLYNLFNLPYDSRLIIGKDILSTEPGLAIFGNSSWVSDKGTYFAASSKFVSKDGVEVDKDYIVYMNKLVSNKISMSRNIITNDYYRKVFGK